MDTTTRRYKILVDGAYGAGKTTFIRSVNEIQPVHTGISTTVVMDFGRITLNRDEVIYLFGLPGGRRLDFVWEVLQENFLGIIFLVDATEPAQFREAQRYLTMHYTQTNYPILVAINRTSHPDAWSVYDMRYVLNAADDIPVMGCEAVDPVSARSVIVSLLDHVFA